MHDSGRPEVQGIIDELKWHCAPLINAHGFQIVEFPNLPMYAGIILSSKALTVEVSTDGYLESLDVGALDRRPDLYRISIVRKHLLKEADEKVLTLDESVQFLGTQLTAIEDLFSKEQVLQTSQILDQLMEHEARKRWPQWYDSKPPTNSDA